MKPPTKISARTLFDVHTPNVYTMPSGAPFLKHLAQGLKTALGDDLPTAMILLPTRRAMRALTDAFLNIGGPEEAGKPILLPLMRTLADMDENEPPFSIGDVDIGIPPAIDSVRHQFELAQLVAAKMSAVGDTPDAASALAMTEPLVTLLSDLSMEEVGVEALSALDEDMGNLPEHFQNAAEFTKIIAQYWPDHLSDLGLSEPSARRVALLNAAADIWQNKPPNHPVIIAGSTGTLRATSALIKSVAQMPKGLVILPGLDVHIDDPVWEDIDAQHPQASLKNLISILDLSRSDIPRWPDTPLNHKADMRARILSESLIPADATSDWPARIERIQDSTSLSDPLKEGLEGLSLIEAKTEEEEAGVIALILREALETKGKTAALVTPDPALARRVRAKLSRWGVEADASAGEPLEETLHGSFLALSIAAVADPFDPVALSGLVRHALFAPEGFEEIDAYWDALEKKALRGPRVKTVHALEKRLGGKCLEGLRLFKYVQDTLSGVQVQMGNVIEAGIFARAHTQILEKLAGGAHNIWRGEAGEKSASLMEELMAYGGCLPSVDGAGYMRLLSMLMRGRVVRPRYGTEERIKILGPLEARMLDVDRLVLGGLNEGVWPAAPSLHPVLSRGMRLKIGLTAPERRFGLAAHDFAQLSAHPDVTLTRSQRMGDGPAVQSRWLWRLTTLVKGAAIKGAVKEDVLNSPQPYLEWSRALDVAPQNPIPAPRPAPRPPLSARWPKGRKLSVTQISTWVRDPYAIYVRTVLGLSPLDGLDEPIGPREFGTAIHKALEKIDGANGKTMFALLQDELRRAGYEEHMFARMNVRLETMADWLSEWAKTRKREGWRSVAVEEKGRLEIKSAGGNFALTGIPDRIDNNGDEFSILDYKTGVLPSEPIVKAGFDPQLPLLSVMLYEGCFEKLSGEYATELRYMKPNGKSDAARHRLIKSKDKTFLAQDYAQDAREALEKLIANFDAVETAYYSQPRAKNVNPYGDYDHLARRAEWAVLRDGGSE